MVLRIKTSKTQYEYVLDNGLSYDILSSGILVIKQTIGNNPLYMCSPYHWEMIELE